MSSTSAAPALAFRLGPDNWSPDPSETTLLRLAQTVAHAREIITDAGLPIPEHPRLELIAKAGVESNLLMFVAALHEPSAAELDALFVAFVLNAVGAGDPRETSSL